LQQNKQTIFDIGYECLKKIVSENFKEMATWLRRSHIGVTFRVTVYSITTCQQFQAFVSHPPSSINRTQPKPATCSEVSAIWKCTSEIWSIPFTQKSKARKPP